MNDKEEIPGVTMSEIREACGKFVLSDPLSEKERLLANEVKTIRIELAATYGEYRSLFLWGSRVKNASFLQRLRWLFTGIK